MYLLRFGWMTLHELIHKVLAYPKEEVCKPLLSSGGLSFLPDNRLSGTFGTGRAYAK